MILCLRGVGSMRRSFSECVGFDPSGERAGSAEDLYVPVSVEPCIDGDSDLTCLGARVRIADASNAIVYAFAHTAHAKHPPRVGQSKVGVCGNPHAHR